MIKTGRPITSNTTLNTRRRAFRLDKKVVKAAAGNLANGLPNADAEFADALLSSVGQQLYSALAVPVRGASQLHAVVSGLAGTIANLHAVKPMPKLNTPRGSRAGSRAVAGCG
jgi:hypothetical protein